MFERFTDYARQVVAGAQEHARELRHRRVGTEHVLLGMLTHAPDGLAAHALAEAGVTEELVRTEIVRRMGIGGGPLGEADADALKAIGIDLDAVRSKVEESFGPGALDLAPDDPEESGKGLVRRLRRRRPWPAGHIPFAPRSKKVLELSLREALRLKHNYIGTEHILLGMLREGEGLAVQILVESGVDVLALKRRTEDIDRAA